LDFYDSKLTDISRVMTIFGKSRIENLMPGINKLLYKRYYLKGGGRLIKKKTDGCLILLILIALLLSGTIIYVRVEIAEKNNELPNYVFKGDTVVAFREPSFYTDELGYYNYQPSLSFFQGIFSRVSSFFEAGILSNLNFYGYYIYFLRCSIIHNERNWWLVIIFSGFAGYIIFVILVYYILKELMKLQTQKAFFLSLPLMVSPIILIHSASWMRDLFIYDLLLLALIFACRHNFKGFVFSTLLQSLLRAYMVIPHVTIFLVFGARNRVKLSKILIIILLLLIALETWLAVKFLGSERFVREFPVRLVEAFTGVNLYLITGRMLPRKSIYSILYDFNIIGQYYTVFLYAIIYFGLLIQFLLLRVKLSDIQRSFWMAFVLLTLEITILHSAALGFFVPRILMLGQLTGYIAFISTLRKHSETPLVIQRN